MAAYRIDWADGAQSGILETYEQACAAVLASYPEAEIGHDGDLAEGGDRTLCWSDAESSIDDDGRLAICSIWIETT